MLLPALQRARDTAKAISCLNNHKQIGMGINMYISDNDGWYMMVSYNVKPAGDYESYANNDIRRWPSGLINGGYAKHRKGYWNNIDFNCPILEQKYLDDTNYRLNGLSSYGYGLSAAAVGRPANSGCKNSQIKKPSSFCILTDAWDKRSANQSTTVFSNYTEFPTLVQKNTIDNTKKVNPYNHNNASNYLFADGHAEKLHYSDINNWHMFCLDETYVNLNNWTVANGN